MAENSLKYNAGEKIVSGVILRLVNGYKPGPLSSRGDRGILNRMIRKALQGGIRETIRLLPTNASGTNTDARAIGQDHAAASGTV